METLTIKSTAFDSVYSNSERHFNNIENDEYIRHNIDVFNAIEINGQSFDAYYQTGQSYYQGNYSAPSTDLELSRDAGTDMALVELNSMSEQEIENLSDEDLDDVLSTLADYDLVLASKDQLMDAYLALMDNNNCAGQAESYVDESKIVIINDDE